MLISTLLSTQALLLVELETNKRFFFPGCFQSNVDSRRANSQISSCLSSFPIRFSLFFSAPIWSLTCDRDRYPFCITPDSSADTVIRYMLCPMQKTVEQK